MRRGNIRLPVARIHPASGHCSRVVFLGLHSTAAVRARVRATQGPLDRSTLCSLTEQDAAHLTS